MPKPNGTGDQQSHEGRAKEGMRDAAMMLELGNWAAQSPDQVDVWRFGGQHHG